MKKLSFILIFIAFFMLNSTSGFCKGSDDNVYVKNKLFEIALPKKSDGLFEAKVEKDKISIFDKNSKEQGFGGFAFGIKAYRSPQDYANMPGAKKIGELTDKKGILYDVVLKHPTDVQYDYTKGSEAPKPFKDLYEAGDNVNIKGIKGSTYFAKQGTKGEDLYKDIIKKHILAINEKWDSNKLEEENMSYMYNVLLQSGENVLNKVGYTYYDTNEDGIDELLIGEIKEGAWKGVIYDIYTMVNRTPKHVISGGQRDRYFVCDDVFICREYSSGAGESGLTAYILEGNSNKLFSQVSFKYDMYENPKNPWFLSYGSGAEEDRWDNVSEDTFNERKSVFEKYLRFDFTPLSNFK